MMVHILTTIIVPKEIKSSSSIKNRRWVSDFVLAEPNVRKKKRKRINCSRSNMIDGVY